MNPGRVMNPSRRDFHKLALAVVPASALLRPERLLAAPNSKFNGVQIGTITSNTRVNALANTNMTLNVNTLSMGATGKIDLFNNDMLVKTNGIAAAKSGMYSLTPETMAPQFEISVRLVAASRRCRTHAP